MITAASVTLTPNLDSKSAKSVVWVRATAFAMAELDSGEEYLVSVEPTNCAEVAQIAEPCV